MVARKKVLNSRIKGILLLGILVSFSQCARRVKLSNPSSYKKVITMYTSNNQSVTSPIMVQFVEDAVKEEGKNKINDFFTISPEVEGKLIWDSKSRLKFSPKNKLKSGENYTVTIELDKIYSNIPDSLKTFTFEFKTKNQNFDIDHLSLSPLKDSMYHLSGKITSADRMVVEEAQKVLKAKLESKSLKIKWNKLGNRNNRIYFTIDSIPRGIDPQTITVFLDGNPLGLDIKKEKTVKVHALGDFKLTNAEVNQDKDQRIILYFSEFIKASQDMEGLIYTDKGEFEMTVNQNKVTLIFKDQISGEVKVTAERALVSERNYKLQEKTEKTVKFEAILPGIRIVDKNTILPNGDNLPLVFESVNLHSVDVKITKVYQKNILQFFQFNDFDESYRLNYVGDVVFSGKIALSTKSDFRMWNTQVIDLKKLIAKDPGALYHIDMGFRRSYTTYPCDKKENENFDPSTIGLDKKEKLTEENFWVKHDTRSYYNWEERHNPCDAAFYADNYQDNGTISTNILGSNLGLIAKEEKNGNLLVAVTSIKSTNPLSHVKIEAFNLKNIKLKSAFTNEEGIAKLNGINDPFLVVASLGKERGYLKLNHSEAISLSRFDVDGNATQRKAKGFLYAERGVWRPGDSIYVNLILDTKFNNLPSDYPIGFEFTNPNGQLVERRTTSKGLNGHYTFWTKTGLNDMTGDYYVKAYVGDAVFTKSIKIETIRPNRLKMNFSLGNKEGLHAKEKTAIEFTTKWLHGSPGKNLRHKIDVIYTQKHTSFKGYRNYKFTAPYRDFQSVEKVFLDKSSNEEGLLKDSITMESFEGAPGFVHANFNIKVFEKGGRFSIDQYSTTFYPYSSYVGLKTRGRSYNNSLTTPIIHDLVSLSANGKPKEDKLFVKLYHLEYNWWYDLNNKNKYRYKGVMNKSAIKLDTIQTKNGKAQYKILLGDGYKEGKYLLLVQNSDGHTTGKEMYFYKHQMEYAEVKVEGTKNLKLTTDKKVYKKGETIELSIPTLNSGKVFLSLEDGRKILETKWIKVTGKVTKYSFKATHEMSPYLYANVLYIQPHKLKKNDLPIRMYGVIPIKVESKHSHITPVISMADELKPEKNYEIKISEKNNRPMTYTIAVVDEGLLDITHYKMPKIWKEFNQKPALEVKTWDIFDRVIEAQKFDVRNLLSIGGDGYEEDPEGVKLNRFKPIVKFIGPFYCGPGQTKNHKLLMPNYVGSVKVMVVAGHNQTYGTASKKVTVKNSLMVLGTMPRVLGPKEEITLPVDVFAMKEHIKDVTVEVEGNSLVEVVKEKKKRLSFTKIGDQQVFFKLKTKERFGIAKIKITARSGNETATYLVELQVRPSSTRKTITNSTLLPAGTNYEQIYKSFGYDGTNKISVEVSSIPSINLEKRLDYLIHYPYGCVEQTTSAVFPQLYLTNLMDVEPKRRREIEENITNGIERLKRFQTMDGGFSYWPGGSQSHEWASNYAGHFLLEAKNKGFEVSDDLIKNWIKYQSNKAKNWNYDNYHNLSQAYRLYLLAIANKPEKGAMNRMRLQLKKNEIARCYLAAAYSTIGKTSVANELLSVLPEIGSQNHQYNFGSYSRDNAILLLSLSEVGKKEEAWKVAKALAEELNKNKYMSTQTTAYSLLAMSYFVGDNGSDAKLEFGIDFHGKKQINSKKSLWQKSLKINTNTALSIDNKMKAPIFITVTQSGIPKMEVDTLKETHGLAMDIDYVDLNGNPVTFSKLNQGDDFRAVVTIRNNTKKYQRHVSLSQVFPSGWEIQNSRMSGNENLRNPTNYEDIKDDRVNMFYDISPQVTKTFVVSLNASYLGKFYLPAVETENMYNHDVRARKPGQWIEVLP